MKNIFTIILITLSGSIFSQVIIGDKTGTATDKTSVLLEFANTGNKGIILPYSRTKNTTTSAVKPTEGTLILDATTPTTARVKYFNGVVTTENPDGWVDLSGQNADVTTALTDQPTNPATEPAQSKTIIGAITSEADGVLVLESATKAMVLPIVSSTDNVINPSPGMMVYINGTNKRLAVFNGSKWSFWKPQ